MHMRDVPGTGSQGGFTLIELSIVLVIIGLIIGGVLVGQDMIHSAEIRSTVGQIEKYNTAVNTFRSKYNGLPGDIVGPANYGMQATDANNKGNGLIESCTANNGVLYGCENAAFWNHLSSASLVDGSFTVSTVLASYGGAITFSGANLPTAKLGKGNYIFVSLSGGFNQFRVVGLTSSANATGVVTSSNALSPSEGFQIDTKLDDGVPTSGIVMAYDGAALAYTLQASNVARCQYTANKYNVSDAPDTPLCNLAIRTSF